MFNDQIVLSVEEKLQPGGTELLKAAVLLCGQSDARESPAAGSIAAFAAFIAVDWPVQQEAMFFYPFHSEQIHS